MNEIVVVPSDMDLYAQNQAATEGKTEAQSLEAAPTPQPNADAVKALTSEGVSVSVAQELAKEHSMQRIENAIAAAKHYAKTHVVGNMGGLVKQAVERGWPAPLPPQTKADKRRENPSRFDDAIRAPRDFVEASERERLMRMTQGTPILPHKSPESLYSGLPDTLRRRMERKVAGGMVTA